MHQHFAKALTLISLVALLAGVAGCGTEKGEDEKAPTFGDAQGQETLPAAPGYPEVVGWQVGRSIPNFTFIGYANFRSYGAPGEYQLIRMSDFYNPTGDEMWPEGSPYGSGPKPTVLMMDISAVWCGPCKYESSVILPAAYEKYGPQGGYFMTALIEGKDQDNPTPTNFDELTAWATNYKFDVPLVLDPEWNTRVFLDEGWPTNLIIRTSDMKIIDRLAGVPELTDSFWKKYESMMDGSYQDPQ